MCGHLAQQLHRLIPQRIEACEGAEVDTKIRCKTCKNLLGGNIKHGLQEEILFPILGHQPARSVKHQVGVVEMVAVPVPALHLRVSCHLQHPHQPHLRLGAADRLADVDHEVEGVGGGPAGEPRQQVVTSTPAVAPPHLASATSEL